MFEQISLNKSVEYVIGDNEDLKKCLNSLLHDKNSFELLFTVLEFIKTKWDYILVNNDLNEIEGKINFKRRGVKIEFKCNKKQVFVTFNDSCVFKMSYPDFVKLWRRVMFILSFNEFVDFINAPRGGEENEESDKNTNSFKMMSKLKNEIEIIKHDALQTEKFIQSEIEKYETDLKNFFRLIKIINFEKNLSNEIFVLYPDFVFGEDSFPSVKKESFLKLNDEIYNLNSDETIEKIYSVYLVTRILKRELNKFVTEINLVDVRNNSFNKFFMFNEFIVAPLLGVVNGAARCGKIHFTPNLNLDSILTNYLKLINTLILENESFFDRLFSQNSEYGIFDYANDIEKFVNTRLRKLIESRLPDIDVSKLKNINDLNFYNAQAYISLELVPELSKFV